MKIKKILIIFFSIFFLIIFFNFLYLKSNIKENYPNIGFIKYLFKKESLLNKINNDYNIKFLPNTEFVKLNFVKKKLLIFFLFS